MTAGLLERPALTAMTDAELEAECERRGHDYDLLAPVLAEIDRRDAAVKARTRRRQRDADWLDMAHAQYLAAEAATNGHLLSPAGEAMRASLENAVESDGRDPECLPWPRLWTGPEHTARLWASEELREWWDSGHKRLTVTEYRAQERAQMEAYTDERLADNDPPGLRHESAADTRRDVPRARPARDWRPARPAERLPVRRPVMSPLRAELARRADAARGWPQDAAPPAPGAAVPGEDGQARVISAPAWHELSGRTVALRDPGTIARQRPEIDGAQLLDYVRAFLGRYARMPSEAAADVVALWVAHAHCRDAGGTLLFETTPRLMLLSSQPGSGKSRVLGLARMMCGGRYGLLTEPTAWALGHILGPSHEAAFIDEGDVLFGRGSRKESVRALLNAGYSRDGVIAHMRGKTVEDLAVFGPVAVAGLDVMRTATGASLEPLFTRSVTIRMRQAAEAVPPLDRAAREAAALLHAGLATWAATSRPVLAEAPAMPDWLANRDAEVWSPLLAVAEAAGQDWPDRALDAAAELCGAWEQDQAETDVMAGLEEMFG